MLLYRRKKLPFIIRVLRIILYPEMIFTTAAMIGIVGFALPLAQLNDMKDGIIILFIILWLIVYASIIWRERIHAVIVRIEVDGESLQVEHMHFDREENLEIPISDLNIEFIQKEDGEDKKHYFLAFRNKAKNIELKMKESKKAVYDLLCEIEKGNVIALRPSEKAFITKHKRDQASNIFS